jgi:hypothetical protein
MTSYTDEEKAIIANYLVKSAKRLIDGAGTNQVDWYARLFVYELEELGKNKEADEVYEYYKRVWGKHKPTIERE